MEHQYGPLSAEFYQLTKVIDAPYPDLDFYVPILKYRGGKTLEVGSGTGRFLIPALEANLKIEGIENNPFMLKWWKRNSKVHSKNCKVYTTNFLNSKIPANFYENIILSFGCLQLFSNILDLKLALKECFRLLKNNGKVFIDLDITRIDLGKSKVWSFGTKVECLDGSFLNLDGSKDYDFVNQIETHHLRYERWKKNKLVETEWQDLKLRWIGLEELKLLLNEQGFKNITHCFDYDSSHLLGEGWEDVINFSAQK